VSAAEHLTDDPTSALWGEHRSRYRFAMPYAAGKRVLDVASGAGFGLAMLRQAGAAWVVGMDRDPSAVREARQLSAGTRLVQADAAGLPLPDASIDLIASFETLEHVPNARAMVHELKRVLRPDGVLVLSTPNRDFGPPELHTGNPFHVQEFTASELRDLLGEAFERVTIYGQLPDRAYRFVPFLMVEQDWTPPAIAWKLLNRLPFGVKERLARSLGGRSWYPSEHDYRFDENNWAGAHALLAVAS
jgi:SAM-dependent methyltransferase